MFINNTFSKRLSEILSSLGLSDYKVAKAIGIHASTIKNYKIGKTLPDNLKLEAIAKYLQVDKQWLATGEVDKGKTEENPSKDPEGNPDKFKEEIDFLKDQLTISRNYIRSLEEKVGVNESGCCDNVKKPSKLSDKAVEQKTNEN